MPFTDFSGILWLLLIPSVLIVVAFRRRGGVGRVSEPCCARCHYPTHGLPTAICPECGSDLSAPQAVLHPGVKPPVPALLWLPLIITCGLLLSIFVSPVLQSSLPTIYQEEHHIKLIPKSGQYRAELFWIGSGVGRFPDMVKLTLTAQQAGAYFEIEDHGSRCAYHGPDPQMITAPYDATTVNAAMRSLAIDVSDEHVDHEVNSIIDIVRNIGNLRGYNYQDWIGYSSTSRGGYFTPRWYTPTLDALWSAIGLASFALLYRRQHSRGD